MASVDWYSPVMSLRVPGGVYMLPPSGAPLSPGSGPPQNQTKPPAAVAIVTPQRSNSLDFLNFEEKRQLIASSLSLTDFLHHGGSATSPSSPTSGNVYLGKASTVALASNYYFHLDLNRKSRYHVIALFLHFNARFVIPDKIKSCKIIMC